MARRVDRLSSSSSRMELSLKASGGSESGLLFSERRDNDDDAGSLTGIEENTIGHDYQVSGLACAIAGLAV